MAPTSGQVTGIYIGMICTALVLSTLLILTMTLNTTVFIAILSFYLVGCFAYLFAFLIIKKKELSGDIKYTVADYMTLFNMILCLFIFVMSFVIPSFKAKKSMSYPMMYPGA